MKNKMTKVFAAVYGFLCAMLLLGVNSSAYIDPSVMTYVIQAVAGVAIAVGAAVGIYFRRAKKKINEKMGIDENKNKEVESDDILLKAEGEAEEASLDIKEAVEKVAGDVNEFAEKASETAEATEAAAEDIVK